MFSLSRVKKLSVSFLIGLLLVVSACDDFFETDISQEEIELVSPADGIATEFFVQTFSWERLNGANSYHLQIVSTSFDNIELMVLDTVIVKTSFTHELFSGEFEWRVKGLNYTSETAYSTRSLTILSGGETVDDSNLLDLTIHLPVASVETNFIYMEFVPSMSSDCSSCKDFPAPVNVFDHKFFTEDLII